MRCIFAIFMIFLVSCSSYKPITIESVPSKARVHIYDNEQKKFIHVGETPFILNKKEKEQFSKGSETFMALKVENPGYVIEHIIYDLKTKKKMEYLLQLKQIEIWSDTNAELSSKLANDIAAKVQQLNRYILTKQHVKALAAVQVLIDQYPKAYVFYDIKGSIQLLRGNTGNAKVSLKKSLSLNPENLQSEKLLKVLEEKN